NPHSSSIPQRAAFPNPDCAGVIIEPIRTATNRVPRPFCKVAPSAGRPDVPRPGRRVFRIQSQSLREPQISGDSGVSTGGGVSSGDWPLGREAWLEPGHLLRVSIMHVRVWTAAAVGFSAVFLATAFAHGGEKDTPVSWKKTVIEGKFRSEGVATADVNK